MAIIGKIGNGEWLKSMAIGAAIGAATGAAGGVFSKVIACKLGGALLDHVASSTSRMFNYFKPFAKWGGTTLAQWGSATGRQVGLSAITTFAKPFASNEAFSITVGVSSQLVKNWAAGRPWDYHLTGVLWISAVTGFGGAVASGLTKGVLKEVGAELVPVYGEGFYNALVETRDILFRDAVLALARYVIFSSPKQLRL